MNRRDFFAVSGMAGSGLFSAATPLRLLINAVDAGANPDGHTLNTAILQKAIDRVSDAGGGVVYLPPGIFLSGGLELHSRVTLHLEAGAVLRGSTKVEDYRYHPGPPEEGDANGRHLIFARKAEDIAITGMGTIDGQGQAFWRRKGRTPPAEDALWGDVIAWDYEPATPRRPSPMLEFAECKNVRVEGVTLTNAAGWTMRPVACESVYICGIRVRNPIYAPNTDGMDITACRNVFVAECDIATGDDAICIKSENPYGELLPTKNITVTNCVLSTCCNGFKIGTATFGAVENIVFSNSVIYNDDESPLNERATSGIAIEMVDGGMLDGILVSNIRMQNVRTPIFVRLGKRTPRTGSFLKRVMLRGIEATGAVLSSSISGVPDMKIEGVTLRDIRIHSDEKGLADWTHRTVPEQLQSYPEARMFGRLPAAGLYVRHAERIHIDGFDFRSSQADARPTLFCEDVQYLNVSGLECTAPAGQQPIVAVRNTQDVFLHGSRAPQGTHTYLQVAGRESSGIVLTGNDLSRAAQVVSLIDNATHNAFIETTS